MNITIRLLTLFRGLCTKVVRLIIFGFKKQMFFLLFYGFMASQGQGYVYIFCQMFQRLSLFQGVRIFRILE